MASPDIYADREKFNATEKKYLTVTSELQGLESQYEQSFERIMELEEKIKL